MRCQGYFCPSVANAAGEMTRVEAAEHSSVPVTLTCTPTCEVILTLSQGLTAGSR